MRLWKWIALPLAMCLLLAGCGGKTAVKDEQFIQSAIEAGLESEMFNDYAVALDMENDVVVTYHTMDSKKSAQSFYEELAGEMDEIASEDPASKAYTDSSGSFQKYTLESEGMYRVLIRVKDRILWAESSLGAGREKIDALIEALNY